MARPRKMNSDELVELVNSYFTTEAAGNPDMLTCSKLEDYASRNGIQVKAYDFRRDAKVRERIEELKRLVSSENSTPIDLGDAYKSLDIDRLMRSRTVDGFKKSLGELDAYWHSVYDMHLDMKKKYNAAVEKIKKLTSELSEANEKNAQLEQAYKDKNAEAQALEVRNRYLKKMIYTYLYPAIANEILVEEEQLENPDTEVTDKAKNTLIDGEYPSSFSGGTAEDRKLLKEEEEFLKQMWDAVPE